MNHRAFRPDCMWQFLLSSYRRLRAAGLEVSLDDVVRRGTGSGANEHAPRFGSENILQKHERSRLTLTNSRVDSVVCLMLKRQSRMLEWICGRIAGDVVAVAYSVLSPPSSSSPSSCSSSTPSSGASSMRVRAVTGSLWIGQTGVVEN